MLIALEAACGLAWQGDMRVCVFIADAPAHGFTGEYGGDDHFPDGLCPDQRTPLPTVGASTFSVRVENAFQSMCLVAIGVARADARPGAAYAGLPAEMPEWKMVWNQSGNW